MLLKFLVEVALIVAACNCTQKLWEPFNVSSLSVCLFTQSQHRFCGDLGKYFLSAWQRTEGRSLVIQPSSWLTDQQQFRKATASIILTRQSDDGFNCSQKLTHLVKIHHTEPHLCGQSLLNFQLLPHVPWCILKTVIACPHGFCMQNNH